MGGRGGAGSFGTKKLRAADEAAFRRVEKRDRKEESDFVEDAVDRDVFVVAEEDEREVDSELTDEVVEYDNKVGEKVISSVGRTGEEGELGVCCGSSTGIVRILALEETLRRS